MVAKLNYKAPLLLISISIIAYQLILVQLLSYIQWHHFAFMIISLAMLGFGTAGTFLSVFKEKLLQNSRNSLFLSLLASSVCMCVAIPLSQLSFFRFDSYLIFSDATHIARFTATCFIYFLPIFFGALAIGLIFYIEAKEIGKVYFFNLLGSAIGGVLAPLFMWLEPPESLPYYFAVLPLMASYGIVAQHSPLKFRLLTLAAILIIVLMYIFHPAAFISEYKDLAKAQLLPKAKITAQKSSPYGQLHVLSSPTMRYSHEVSISFEGEIPIQPMYFVNADWIGAQIEQKANDNHIMDHAPIAFPFMLRTINSALFLHGGTFAEPGFAAFKNVDNIIATEPNPDIRKQFEALAVPPQLSNIEIIDTGPRTYLEATEEKFDLIGLPSLGSFGGNAGTHALKEDYIYTLEGLDAIWQCMDDQGWIKITVWNDFPPRNMIRLGILIRTFLNQKGTTDIRSNVLILKNWGSYTYFVSKSEISIESKNVFTTFCEEKGFEPFLFDEKESTESKPGQSGLNNTFDSYLNAALFASMYKIADTYSFKLMPPTDDQPFFHQFLRQVSYSRIKAAYASSTVPYFEIGYLMVWVTLCIVLILALVFIVFPIIATKKLYTKSVWWIPLYFGSIGLGYLFIEMNFIQQGILLLGNPIFAISATFGIMLLSSGAGSYLSQKLSLHSRNSLLVFSGIVTIAILYAFVFIPMVIEFIHFTKTVKVLLFILMVGPLAFLMGFPFPYAIRMLSEQKKELIPWAWTINGYFSVISSPLALIVAVEFGFTSLWMLSGLLYAIPAAIVGFVKFNI